MEDKRCYVRECTADVEYIYPRSSPAVYACKLHAKNYLDKNGKACSMKSILEEPSKGIRKVFFNFCAFFSKKKKGQKYKVVPKNSRDKRTKADDRLNKTDLEEESKMAYPALKKNSNNQNSPSIMQVYQDNALTHNQQISLYNLMKKDNRTTLLIYSTEIETKQEKIINTPETLDLATCITQLPNGKLFCYGNCLDSGITLIIDESGGVQELPSGTPCRLSSAIYFKSNVYCFGGANNITPLTLFSRFDLDWNKWVQLAPLPKADDICNSIIFNKDILISGWLNTNLVRYSIGRNSFTTIPYQFEGYKRKILINGERLYLFECKGSMYESEIGSYTAWRRIAKSTINFNPGQTYCSYNKREVYIGCINSNYWHGFRFNLANKALIKLPK